MKLKRTALIRELLSRLYNLISRTTHLDPHPGLIIATHHLSDPYPLAEEIELLSVSVMDLLAQYAFPSLSGYGKFTISLTIMQITDALANSESQKQKGKRRDVLVRCAGV